MASVSVPPLATNSAAVLVLRLSNRSNRSKSSSSGPAGAFNDDGSTDDVDDDDDAADEAVFTMKSGSGRDERKVGVVAAGAMVGGGAEGGMIESGVGTTGGGAGSAGDRISFSDHTNTIVSSEPVTNVSTPRINSSITIITVTTTGGGEVLPSSEASAMEVTTSL